MSDIDGQIDEFQRMKKQIKVMTIALVGLGALTITTLADSFIERSGSQSGWPDMSAGVLQAKRIVLMSDDGKVAGMLSTPNNAAGLALFDKNGEVRILLTTSGNKGLINLSGEGNSQSTILANGTINIGDEKVGGINMEGPSAGGPSIRVFDGSGYAAQIGRSRVLDQTNGSISLTSAATLMGSSKEKASTWFLLSQPVFAPNTAATQGTASVSAPVRTTSKTRSATREKTP